MMHTALPHYTMPVFLICLLFAADISESSSFRDEAQQRGLLHTHAQYGDYIRGLHDSLGAGACALDIDNNGWMDIFFVAGQGQTRHYGRDGWWQRGHGHKLYRNQGGYFADASDYLPAMPRDNGMACHSADINGNGLTDLVVTGFRYSFVLQNTGEGFDLIMLDTGGHWISSISIADFNGNGFPDIFMTGYLIYDHTTRLLEKQSGFVTGKSPAFNPTNFRGSRNFLWINHGDGKFEESATPYRVENDETRTLFSKVLDINNNGWPDLLLINDHGSESVILLNRNGRHFSPEEKTLLPLPRNANSLAVTAMHNKPAFLLATSSGQLPVLLRKYQGNMQDRIWQSVNGHNMLDHMNNFSVAFADLNHNGNPDMILANGFLHKDSDAPLRTQGQRNAIVYNNGDQFEYITHLPAIRSSRSILLIDVDNDGDKDIIFTNNNAPPELYITQSKPENWLGISLNAQQAARFHTISIETDQRKLVIPLQRGTFMTSHDPRFSIALRPDERVLIATITGFHGEQKAIKKPLLGRYIDINGLILDDTNKTWAQAALPYQLAKWMLTAERLTPNQAIQSFPNWTADQQTDFLRRLTAVKADDWLGAAAHASYSDNNKVTLQALGLFGHWRHEASYSHLERLLLSDDKKIRCRTALVFRDFLKHEDHLLESRRRAMKPMIMNALKYHDICSIEALGFSRDTRPVNALHTLLNEADDTNTLLAIIQAIGELRHTSSHPFLVDLLEHDKSDIRIAANHALHRIDRSFNKWENAEEADFSTGTSCTFDSTTKFIRDCPADQILHYLRNNRHTLIEVRESFVALEAEPALMAEIALMIYPHNPDGILFRYLQSEKSEDTHLMILEIMQHIRISPALQERLKTLLAQDNTADSIRFAIGDVLVQYQPDWLFEHTKGLFDATPDKY